MRTPQSPSLKRHTPRTFVSLFTKHKAVMMTELGLLLGPRMGGQLNARGRGQRWSRATGAGVCALLPRWLWKQCGRADEQTIPFSALDTLVLKLQLQLKLRRSSAAARRYCWALDRSPSHRALGIPALIRLDITASFRGTPRRRIANRSPSRRSCGATTTVRSADCALRIENKKLERKHCCPTSTLLFRSFIHHQSATTST